MSGPEPPTASAAHALYHLVLQNRAARDDDRAGVDAPPRYERSIPLAGVHDALSARIFARNGAPALFLSGFGVSASLLGMPDAGMTNLVEMEMMTRHVCAAVRGCGGGVVVGGKRRPPPIVVDGDTGYGGAPNVLRTVSALATAGAAAITIEDQKFPKKCTIAAGSRVQIAERYEAVERVRGALGARDLYNERTGAGGVGEGPGPWIVARTDCRMAYGFREALERCLRFEELGAEIIYAENLQSRDEYEALRSALDRRTVTMIAQVQETMDAPREMTTHEDANRKPLLTVQEIGELGYDLALFGVTPLQSVVGALESTAKEFLRRDDRQTMVGSGIIGDGEDLGTSQIAISDFATLKQVVGFDQLAHFANNFPCS